jgi:hypothetical protein
VAAVLFALATWIGPSSYLLAGGLLLLLMNELGMFALLQRPRVTRWALYGAFVLFAVSFLLPAERNVGRGWQAAY